MAGKNAQVGLPWSDAPFLLALARAKSFMAAARVLNVDRTTVARRLDRLEATLGAKLFERVAGALDLTAEGRRIISYVERAEQELSHLHPDKQGLRIGFGKVRLSLSPHVLAAFALEVTRFTENHPEIFLELATSDRFVDLHRFEADVALRVGAARPENVHCIELGPVRFGLYRRSDQSGPVRAVFTLPGQTELPKDLVIKGSAPTIVAAVDGVLPTRDLVLAGSVAGVLPLFVGQNDPRLALCSDVIPMERHRLWMSCLSEQRNLVRIKTVMQGLSGLLADALQDLDARA